jgi:hypothetical protein
MKRSLVWQIIEIQPIVAGRRLARRKNGLRRHASGFEPNLARMAQG